MQKEFTAENSLQSLKFSVLFVLAINMQKRRQRSDNSRSTKSRANNSPEDRTSCSMGTTPSEGCTPVPLLKGVLTEATRGGYIPPPPSPVRSQIKKNLKLCFIQAAIDYCSFRKSWSPIWTSPSLYPLPAFNALCVITNNPALKHLPLSFRLSYMCDSGNDRLAYPFCHPLNIYSPL